MTVPAVDHAWLDRAAHERDEPGLIERLRTESTTRVLVIARGLARVRDGRLVLPAVGDVTGAQISAFLGRIGDSAVLLAVADEVPSGPDAHDVAGDAADDAGWAHLREVGGDLHPREADLLTVGVALARWVREAGHCPACGAVAPLRQAGWSRRCDGCGREHFPRTDPAVIAAVTDASGRRLLLGSNVAWGAGRFSCFAGFVEAGESAETALVREIEEEAGVVVVDMEYLASQAWPYPRSLMLGYLARTRDELSARPDGVEIVEVRWFTVDEIGEALRGEGAFTLPGRASVARHVIQTWYDRVTADPPTDLAVQADRPAQGGR